MATIPSSQTLPAPSSAVHAPRVWQRVLVPALPDLLFIALIVWLFMSGKEGWSRLLLDGDVGWHIRTGEWILDHGSVPYRDLFSFSKPNEPWFAWEWLTDVLYALLYRQMQLKGVVLASAAVISGFAVLLMRHMVWRGAHVLVSMGVGLLAVGAASIHFHARPHVVTLLLLTVTMWLIDRDRRQPDSWIVVMVPLTVLWTNLHGGFLVGIACLGLVAVGTVLEAWWHRGEERQQMLRQALRYAGLAAACGAATFCNPYGWHLHQHVIEYLRSDWIQQYIQEFQSPNFRTESILQYELLLLAALLLTGISLARKRVTDALLVVFFAHQSLSSVRHVPLFAIVAAPLVACALSEWWQSSVQFLKRGATARILFDMGQDFRAGFNRLSLWPAAFLLFLLWGYDESRWPLDFPEVHFPTRMATRQADLLARSRVFTYDQWADYLVYRFYPRQKVFLDGRSDFFGASLGNEYLALQQGEPTWQKVLDKYAFNVVFCPVKWPLAALLKQRSDWRVIEDDGKAILFLRTEKHAVKTLVPASPENQKRPPLGLMEGNSVAESLAGEHRG